MTGLPRRLRLLAMTLFVIVLFDSSSQAKNDIKLDNFKKIIILEQGRAKPLDTFARNLLLRFSGRSKFNKKPAIDWLARSVFDPSLVYDEKIFLINNPEILEAIGVEPDKHRRYSFSDLNKGLEKLHGYVVKSFELDEKNRTDIDKEFIRIYSNFHDYLQLINSLQFYSKHKDFSVDSDKAVEVLSLESRENSFFEILSRTNVIEKEVSKINSQNAKNLNSEQEDYLKLALNLYRWIEGQKAYDDSFLSQEKLSVVPSLKRSSVDWLSPWDLLLETDQKEKDEVFYLQWAYQAYNNSDQKLFDESINQYRELVNKRLVSYNQKTPKIELELLYNKLNAFGNSKFLYGFAFLFTMLALVFVPMIFNVLASILLALGFLLHSSGIILRMLILERAPVSNLFETFVFVAWVIVLLGIVMKFSDRKSNLGLILASFCGLALLLISGKFASDGDTMEVLIAVLDSNFWLSTHVICVTVGYAGVFAAGIVGHIYLIKAVIDKMAPGSRLLAQQKTNTSDQLSTINYQLKNLNQIILGILGFGLCFSFLGTMLGGIWADQSWGRFWGWDPKENGALLIVLWSTIIFHSRLAGLIKETGVAVCAVIACMVVMTSWFGINLLGVGLHSYGFTNGIASGLYAFYAFEIFFIIATLFLLQNRRLKNLS